MTRPVAEPGSLRSYDDGLGETLTCPKHGGSARSWAVMNLITGEIVATVEPNRPQRRKRAA